MAAQYRVLWVNGRRPATQCGMLKNNYTEVAAEEVARLRNLRYPDEFCWVVPFPTVAMRAAAKPKPKPAPEHRERF